MAIALDVLVVLAYLGLILGIGLAQRGGSSSMEGYALGDRQMAWWAVLASILAAEISAATFLGAPEAGLSRGNWSYAQFAIGTVLARIVVSFLFIPLFYKRGVISLYEYLEERFGPRTRRMASGLFLLTRVLAMGTRLYVSAIILVLALSAWRGGSVDSSEKFALYALAVVVVTGLTAIYTTVGGIRAVIWTDCIQVLVLLAALGFTLPYLLSRIPEGWQGVMAVTKSPLFFDFAPPPQQGWWNGLRHVLSSEYTLWAALIGSTFVTMSTHGIDQDTVQRMLTARNRRQSAVATIVSGLVDLPMVSAFILVGIMLRAFYQAFPDPGLPTETREVFPYFIMHELPAGLRGLVIAAVLATAMGSLSTALNALATSLARDFVLPRLPAGQSDAAQVRVLRRCTLLFALLIMVVGVVTAWFMAHHPKLEILPLVLGILGFTFGSILGVFLVAVLAPRRGSDFGNVLAMSLGIAAVLLLTNPFGLQQNMGIEQPLVLAFPWRITVGTLVTVAVALCFSTPARAQQQDSGNSSLAK